MEFYALNHTDRKDDIFIRTYSEPLIFCDRKSIIMCTAHRVYLQESDVVTALRVRVLNV